MKRRIAIIVMALGTALALSACQQTDVVAKMSVTSFESTLNKLGTNISTEQKYNSWALTSPDGDRFLLGKDFAGDTDTIIEVDAAPFLNAGLDTTKLPAEVYSYDQAANKLMIKGEFGSAKFDNANTALDTFKQVVKNNRSSIGYHAKLDHYGIAMGDGNMFEWAKDMSKNDKDIVFVFNPQPFIDAGVDPAKVEGWVFTKVPVMDENNKEIEVDKLLKPFNLD